ncbi:hypothetical protein CRENBAI_012919 [Crenichthys baileyi]|uniref:Uncharacterized protein n=1 Tax=Crenichthys baileyi TaxID=28760 RepID=A0AAV9RLY9_9TELE
MMILLEHSGCVCFDVRVAAGLCGFTITTLLTRFVSVALQIINSFLLIARQFFCLLVLVCHVVYSTYTPQKLSKFHFSGLGPLSSFLAKHSGLKSYLSTYCHAANKQMRVLVVFPLLIARQNLMVEV